MSRNASDFISDEEAFENDYHVFIKCLGSLSRPPAQACEEYGHYNVAWEIKEDVLAGVYLSESAGCRLSEREKAAIREVVEALRSVPGEVTKFTDMRGESLARMQHACWNPIRAMAARTLKCLELATEVNVAYFRSQSYMMSVARLLEELKAWAARRPDVVAVGLVGSHARGTATQSSDVDVVILCSQAAALLEADWPSLFGEVESRALEDYGSLKSIRVAYRNGLEVEFGVAEPRWAATPLDGGTRTVLAEGSRVLYDPDGILTSAKLAAERGGSNGAI